MMTTNHETSANGAPANGCAAHHERAAPAAPASAGDLFAQFQATTRMLLEVQQAQQRTLENFLATQERVLLYCLQGSPAQSAPALRPPLPLPPVPALPELAALPPPAPAAPTAPPALPAPVLGRPPVPIPAAASPPPRPVVPAASRAEVRPPAPPAERVPERPAAVPAPAGEAPPTEAFRRDLLQLVSDRTGYPLEALDETMPLEAGLGIDSIKTVEIFSGLKGYHAYFRTEQQEEEEMLGEFARLKTLRDIIDLYDRRRQTASAPAANGKADRGPSSATWSGRWKSRWRPTGKKKIR